MANRGRPTAELILSGEERETLSRWSRRPKSSQRLALRSRIVLACAGGSTNTEVAERLGVSRSTVGKWRSRFVQRRLDGLVDEPRPGAPRTITDEKVEEVITETLESTPKDATHWSRTSMAKRSGLSPSTIGRVWKAFRLKPHLTETFKLSTDPLFIDKVRDVVGLYLDPPERSVVFCVDEKGQVQALDRSTPVLPMMPGMPEKRSHDYARHGTSWLNMVERWFGELTTKLLKRGVHKSVQALEADIRAWIKIWNEDPRPTCGPKPPTKSSTASKPFVNELQARDTSCGSASGSCAWRWSSSPA